ncbi:MAG: FHA domain-containing protein, partial [Anaerolineae bacterium]
MDAPETPHLLDPLGRPIPLTTVVTLLGRDAECDVVIPDRQASRRHAEIVRGGEAAMSASAASPDARGWSGFILHDLDSTNGTLLNGR